MATRVDFRRALRELRGLRRLESPRATVADGRTTVRSGDRTSPNVGQSKVKLINASLELTTREPCTPGPTTPPAEGSPPRVAARLSWFPACSSPSGSLTLERNPMRNRTSVAHECGDA